MSISSEDMIRRLLRREPTAEDYKTMNQLIRDLPPELVSSPGVMAEIILRMEHVRELKAIMKQAAFEGQQRIHHDLDARVDRAAISALSRIRDTMPYNADDGAWRLLWIAFYWMVGVAVVAATASWMVAAWYMSPERQAHHAATETEFSRCVNAAAGGFTIGAKSKRDASEARRDMVRNDLMICAAEYADRRAGDL
ncbi:hypothetical protein P7B04_00015 [Sphingobium yanoikuyae]|uniref:hypothetical protein n=1 Tax=Sphingobium yanoikuyae TaxID=13690 RepID=UPI00111316E3|nr:hypothetical protein [Sphingobium yanoikuyae]MDG2511069.1 hypothetical protein [Sphingobium yanoikuyae]